MDTTPIALLCVNCDQPSSRFEGVEDGICNFCRKFTNKAMARKLRRGECLSVLSYGREIGPGLYELKMFFDEIDWADPARERWINSIGKNLHTGVIHAAVDNRFYGDERNWECIFLR